MTPSVIVLSFVILLLLLVALLILMKGAGDATAKHEADQDGLRREGEEYGKD